MNNAGHWTVWDGVLARPWYCGRTSGLDVALSGSVAGPAGAPGCRRPLWPRLLAALDTVSAHLTTGSLCALDARVERRGQDPRLAAGSWLRTQGLASMGVTLSEKTETATTRAGVASLPPGPAVRPTARHRRPTGAPPPLPHPVSVTTRAWLVLLAVVLAGVIVILLWAPSLRLDDQVNTAVLRLFARARTPWLTRVADGISAAGSGWGATVAGLSAVVLTMVFRRWRHLLVFLCSLFLLEVAIELITEGMTRPRPYGVLIIADWTGYSAPALSVTILTFLLISIAYCLVVPGRARSYAKAAIAVIVTVFCLACLYLAVDHVDDLLLGVVLGVAIPVSAFRFFTPNEVFPVAYRSGNTAHVDVTGARGEAIRQGVRDQLGLTVTGITPVGLESSAGSTPLRLRTEGAPQEYLFAKLYTKGHVRADHWYKLWRTILYGRLEDENSFGTVRRLAEYEDYALRLLQDVGIAVPRPYGIVEITPEREYLLVTEFFDGAVEIGDADIGDQVIDQGLLLIRALWDAGIAHRDIKPGNLMVRDGQLLLIDVAFAQVRPSPWRQAVDLGNMMLVLAVRTDPGRVYRQALNYFTEAELAEAFAATRGVASPTQLRAFMKRDPRDLLAEFRTLAPQRRPIVLQRWSVRRVTTAAVTLAIFAVPAVFGIGLLLPASNGSLHAPDCGTGHTMILAAQAVPSAAFLPCINALPSGWTTADGEISSGRARFVLNSGQAGMQAVTITLTATCDTSGARQIRSGQPGMRRFERPLSLVPAYSEVRYYTFPGGCATYQFAFTPGTPPAPATAVDSAVAFIPRSELAGYVQRTEGLALCGRGAACPG
jgi:tRNA A-37 threonylcarbamoyl transferase component Bud32